MSFYVYILKSKTTGRYYIGHTDNIGRRVAQHNDSDYKGSRYTKAQKGPWQLVFKEEFPTRGEAMRREKELKGKKRRHLTERLIADSLVEPQERG